MPGLVAPSRTFGIAAHTACTTLDRTLGKQLMHWAYIEGLGTQQVTCARSLRTDLLGMNQPRNSTSSRLGSSLRVQVQARMPDALPVRSLRSTWSLTNLDSWPNLGGSVPAGSAFSFTTLANEQDCGPSNGTAPSSSDFWQDVLNKQVEQRCLMALTGCSRLLATQGQQLNTRQGNEWAIKRGTKPAVHSSMHGCGWIIAPFVHPSEQQQHGLFGFASPGCSAPRVDPAGHAFLHPRHQKQLRIWQANMASTSGCEPVLLPHTRTWHGWSRLPAP